MHHARAVWPATKAVCFWPQPTSSPLSNQGIVVTAYTDGMESEKPLNQFQEVYKKVQERLARDRERREKGAELRKKEAEKEAVREGFDRA
jgi:hypothetical protein